MRVLELFAGIGACSKALERLGFNVEIVDAVEIDKYAIASFNAIHNTNFEVQDIKEWNKDLKDIDLITHGSPCQDFSVAGKQAGGDINSGTRSSLMYETIRIVGKLRPKYVLWENVKNLLSKKHKHNFDAYIETMNILGYNSYYEVLNAKDYGIPQNRERVYTISIRRDVDKFNFQFPKKEELKLRLKDMLEENVDEKYYLSDKTMSDFITDTKNDIKMIGKLDIKGHDCVKRVYGVDGISPTLTDMQGGNRQPKIMTIGNYMPSGHDASRIVDEDGIAPTVKENHGTVTAVAMRGRYNASGKVEQQIEISSREIANSITTVQKDSMVGEEKLLVKNATKKGYDEAVNGDSVNLQYSDSNTGRGRVGHQVSQTLMANDSMGVVERINKNSKHQQDLVQSKEDICRCIPAGTHGSTPHLLKTIVNENPLRIRKLTPRECWRLMGFADEDFEKAKNVPMSNTQLYKQARKLYHCKCFRKNIQKLILIYKNDLTKM